MHLMLTLDQLYFCFYFIEKKTHFIEINKLMQQKGHSHLSFYALLAILPLMIILKHTLYIFKNLAKFLIYKRKIE